jgi:hypothetical protein
LRRRIAAGFTLRPGVKDCSIDNLRVRRRPEKDGGEQSSKAIRRKKHK